MNTKIITALVIAFALVGLTGAASASSITAGTYYDYITGGGVAPGEMESDSSHIEFLFQLDTAKVTSGMKDIDSDFGFEAGQGSIVKESLTHHAEIENTITSVVNPMTGKEDRIFTTTDFAFVDLVWQEAEGGLTDVDKINKSVMISSDARAYDEDLTTYKKDVIVTDISSMSGSAEIQDASGTTPAFDPAFGTMKGGDFYFGSSSFAIVETEGDMLQAIFAGSGLDYTQSNWGKLESDGMISQTATVDQSVKVNVTP